MTVPGCHHQLPGGDIDQKFNWIMCKDTVDTRTDPMMGNIQRMAQPPIIKYHQAQKAGTKNGDWDKKCHRII